ncbi:MAG: hypothetical protein M4579_003386 [Chaenotheca gracillima]|nr:MAG: hypothetical protein M4579_003386 [Chaenotheca gracillima]
MLGAIFSHAASALKPSTNGTQPSAKSNVSLESVQEEIHTRSLLFPDPAQVSSSSSQTYPLPDEPFSPTPGSAKGFDELGKIDLQYPRDCRIIIAQDAIGSSPKMVLFDSKSTPAPPQRRGVDPENDKSQARPSQSSTSFEGRSARRPQSSSQSLAAERRMNPTPTSDAKPSGGAFDRAQRRGMMVSVDTDTRQRPTSNDSAADTKLLLDCMFGAAPLKYKGDSTKLHVFPDQRSDQRHTAPSPAPHDGQGSFGRAEGRRRSQLAQSYTPGDLPSVTAADLSNAGTTGKGDGRKTVVITRTFSVPAPGVNSGPFNYEQRAAVAPGSVESTNHFPFLNFEDATSSTHNPNQRKLPMFAIAFVLQVPATTNLSSGHGHSLHSDWGQSLPFESDLQAGGMFLDTRLGLSSSPNSLMHASDVDDRMDMITQHWDIITRSLMSLQKAVRAVISRTLHQVLGELPQNPSGYFSQVQRRPSAPRSPSLRGGDYESKEGRQTLKLSEGALEKDQSVRRVVDREGLRLIEGLRTPRVVTGQDRWGIWREEARWIGRWGAGKEQKFFFFNLLTAFLGNHTCWLSALGPKWHRKRHHQQQKAHGGDDYTIASRTVIVANDKMAARRLIFLLSAFFPAASNPLDNSLDSRRFSRSKSGGAFSLGAPSAQASRKNSLRRTINRRSGTSVTPSRKDHKRSVSFSKETFQDDPKGSFGSDQQIQHWRRSSDVRSIQAASLPIPPNPGGTRKSSAATTATITPATTVPHFASGAQSQRSDETGRDSNESLASANLMHTLKRNDSTDQSVMSSESQPPSRWGSLISGIWSNRRDSSTDGSVITAASGVKSDFPVVGGVSRPKRDQPSGKLAQMVQEARITQTLDAKPQTLIEQDDYEAQSQKQVQLPVEDSASKQPLSGQDIPQRPRSSQPQFKLSVDENDGVIDVEVPLPNFMSSSLGSPLGSISGGGFMSTESFDSMSSNESLASNLHFSHAETDLPTNVAGWLKHYHQDFVLQAVKLYPQLEEDIKRSMRAEPTPPNYATTPGLDNGTGERWIDVSTTLVADAQTFSVKRFRLRRRVDHNSFNQPPYAGPLTPRPTTVQEHIVEETIFDMDDTLIDAVERIIAQSGPSSKSHSVASSSRSSSRARRRQDPIDVSEGPTLEISRSECQRMVVGALEQVVKSVTVERQSAGNRYWDETEVNGKTPRSAADGGTYHAGDSTLREGVRKWLSEVEESR